MIDTDGGLVAQWGSVGSSRGQGPGFNPEFGFHFCVKFCTYLALLGFPLGCLVSSQMTKKHTDYVNAMLNCL